MLILGLALGAPAMLLPTARAQQTRAGGDHTLTVTNRSQTTINELHVSSAKDDNWGDDRLGDDTIDPGGSYTIKLAGRDCEYDVQVTYEGGKVEEKRRINVCNSSRLAFDGSGAQDPTQTAESHQVQFVNATTRDITEIYISAGSASDWGDDKLGDDKLPKGERFNATFKGDCAQDVRVVYENKAAEERRGVDLCKNVQLNIQPGWTLQPDLDGPPDQGGSGGGGSGGGGSGGGGSGGGGDSSGNDHRIVFRRPVPDGE
jgi:hypothetical protein